MDYSLQLKEWDDWIRSGLASKVRHLAHKLNHKKIPRDLLVDYAHIARRVGAPELIVHWLRPIVRSEKLLSQPATENEKAIYGLGLLRLGAFREAEQILSEVDPEKDPQVYFYRASLNINQWDYAKAVPHLKKYIRHPAVLPYSRLVGRLNLCAALVTHPRSSETEKIFSELMRELQRQDLPLLTGNLFEIRAQWYYNQNRFESALEDLHEAAKLLKKADLISLLYIDKWQAILQLKMAKDPIDIASRLQALQVIRARAVELKNWETLRDCDLHQAIITQDESLMLKVYWGSKSIAYKKRIKDVFPSLRSQQEFIWNNLDSNGDVVDLISDAPTRSLQKLFFILSTEMYQPLRSTEIIDALYPNEYYNPTSSPVKLHRLVSRARRWLKEMNYPVSIAAFRNSFQLTLRAECRLRLTGAIREFEKFKLPFADPREFFRANDWAAERNITSRAARLQISHLVTQGELEKIGHGSRTKYRIRKKTA